MFKAQLETRNFEFEAYGDTKLGAEMAMADGLREHCRQYRLDFETFRKEFGNDVVVSKIEPYACYRDGEKLKKP